MLIGNVLVCVGEGFIGLGRGIAGSGLWVVFFFLGFEDLKIMFIYDLWMS